MVKRNVYRWLFVLLVVLVAPFFVLTFFAHPSADDYCYAQVFRDGSYWGNIRGEYLGWKGRYSAIFFSVSYHEFSTRLHGGTGMLKTYPYALIVLLASLFGALYVFVRSLLEGVASRTQTLYCTLGLGALYLSTIPKASATLYWLDGASQYQIGGILLLLSLAALMKLYRLGQTRVAITTGFLIFIAIGASELVMLMLVAVVAVMAIDRIFIHKRNRLLWTAVCVVTLASTALLVLAPGNFVRAQYAPAAARQFWFSVSQAWIHGGNILASWLRNPGTWLATVAFIPVALQLIHRQGVRANANWLRLALVSGLLLGLLWLIYFALWWTAATNPPGRALNLIYLGFLMAWFTAVLELIAIVSLRTGIARANEGLAAPWHIFFAAVTVVLGVYLVLHSNARTAAGDLLFRAPAYHQMQQDRYRKIAAAKAEAAGKRVELLLPGLSNPPRLLMYSDIQGNGNDWRNGCYARYFGLKTVVRR